ncbi:MAG: TRAP transporter small permease [Betaproteobacteria bacterium]
MRRGLDRLYNAAAILAAFFLIATLVMVLTGIAGRLFNFYLRGTDAYAGYCMAAASFFALAHTLRRGEHIRVTLILDRLGPRPRFVLEVWCYSVAVFLAGAIAYFSVRLAWQSYTFNDISQGNDATPLWLPQLTMAAGTIVLCIAFVDALVELVRTGRVSGDAAAGAAGPAHIE